MRNNIRRAVEEVRTGIIGPLELAEKSISKAHSLSHLNSFTFISSKNDIRKQNDRIKSNLLPLKGIPIALKDNFCYDQMPATCGSKMLHNFIPPYNATIVQKLIDAGALIIGKTNMDEFGMGNGTIDTIFGPTKNPWRIEEHRISSYSFVDWRVPGGSSGGSAVAVCSDICLAAIGSDTGGSVRNPASYCGVVGLKPTYGLLSRYGLIPLVNSLDVPGILTKTVDDCATILDVIKGFDVNDPTSSSTSQEPINLPEEPNIKTMHIGIPDEYSCEGMDQEIIDTWKDMADFLEKNGAKVSRVSLPHTKYSIVCYSVLNPCEVASNMARYDGFGHRSTKPDINSTESLYAQTRHEGFNSVVRGRILAGNFFLLKQNYEKYFTQAMKVRRLIVQDFEKVWNELKVDLLLTPVTLTTSPLYSEFIKWDNRKQQSVQDYCTQSANMAGIPALSLPIKLSSNSLPISLQILGPKFSEKNILNLAKFMENSLDFV